MTNARMIESRDTPSPAQDALKTVLSYGLSRIHIPIIVNSFGRSGSTVLHQSICASASRIPLAVGKRLPSGAAWDLNSKRLRRGRCYKSHDYPPSTPSTPIRAIYIFGDPVEASVSAYRQAQRDPEWLRKHCAHLRVDDTDPESILRTDALQLGRHLTAWLEQTIVPTLFIRYDTMWNHTDRITDFVGFDVRLPAKIPRARHAVSSQVAERLEAIHASTSALVASLPEHFPAGRA